MITNHTYERKNSLDKEMKPLILKWLSSFNEFKYPHSFKDQWIIWNIWGDKLWIQFDFRQKEQKELFDLLPSCNKGTLQEGTGILVNTDSLYFKVSEITSIAYPEIIGHKLQNKIRYNDADGDDFYEYYWTVYLSDESSIAYRNQNLHMDLQTTGIVYKSIIQERAFLKFLKSI